MNAKFGWCAGISCLLTTLMATSTLGIITGNIISTQLIRLYAAIAATARQIYGSIDLQSKKL
jgi:hypothetical protein